MIATNDRSPPNDRGLPRWAALGVLTAIVAIAAWAMPRHVAAGDAGELATVLLRGGVPHPPGYPWMRLLGPIARAAWAIGVPPAIAAALPCALAGAVGWTWIAHSASRLCAWPFAVFATLLVASAHVVVLHTDDAEVWGPLVLAAAALVWIVTGPRRSPLVIGAVFGGALAVHLTTVFLAPLVLVAAWPAAPAGDPSVPGVVRSPAALMRAALSVACGTVLGLSVFLTLAIGSDDAAWRWGEVDSVAGLVRHVLRADYGTFSLSLQQASPGAVALLGRAFASSARAWTGGLAEHPLVAIGLAIAVAAVLTRTVPRGHRAPVVAIGIAWALAQIGFTLLQNIDPTVETGAWILERFDILPLVLSVIPLALAAEAVLRAVERRGLRLLAAVAGLALIAHQLWTTARRGVGADDDAIEIYARDLLRTPPPGAPAIVLGTDDHRTFAVLYAQQVLGEGPDVVYIDASLLAYPWYRAALRRRLPVLPDEEKPLQMLFALWSDPANLAIPVYLANDFSRPSTTLPRVPEGVLWRVVPQQGADADPEAIVERHLAARARLVGPPTAASSPFARDLAATWPLPELALQRALVANGRADLVARLNADRPQPRF